MKGQELFSTGLEAIRAYEKETGADHGVLYCNMSEVAGGEYAALFPPVLDGGEWKHEMLIPSGRVPARSGLYFRWDHRDAARESMGLCEKLLGIVAEEEAERKEKRLPRIVASNDGHYILVDWPKPPEGVKVLKGRSPAMPPIKPKAEDYIYVEGLRSLARILARPEYRHTILLLRALAMCPDKLFVEDLLAGSMAFEAPHHFPMKGATKEEYGTVPVPELIRNLGSIYNMARILMALDTLEDEQ